MHVCNHCTLTFYLIDLVSYSYSFRECCKDACEEAIDDGCGGASVKACRERCEDKRDCGNCGGGGGGGGGDVSQRHSHQLDERSSWLHSFFSYLLSFNSIHSFFNSVSIEIILLRVCLSTQCKDEKEDCSYKARKCDGSKDCDNDCLKDKAKDKCKDYAKCKEDNKDNWYKYAYKFCDK